MLLNTQLLSAQGKSIKRIEIQEREAYQLYQQKQYKEACDIYIQTTAQRTNIQTSKIHFELFIIFLIVVVGFFLYLYLEKQRAYKKLVSKNCCRGSVTCTAQAKRLILAACIIFHNDMPCLNYGGAGRHSGHIQRSSAGNICQVFENNVHIKN